MAEHPEDSPLATGSLAGSEEALVAPALRTRGSNSRALKVAGLTTLVCLLVASQVFTAYMVFNQKEQLHTLQKNNEKLGRQMSRSSHAPMRMAMPMSNLPLLMDFTTDEDSKTPKKPKTSETPPTKPQTTTVVSVEKQVMDLLQQTSELPQFNETFLGNLMKLKEHINESQWESLNDWMRNWFFFEMIKPKQASSPPAPQPTAAEIKTKCQLEASTEERKLGVFKPQCDEQGRYLSRQCWHATGYCWCVDASGNPIEGTKMRGKPDCSHGPYLHRRLAVPARMQKTFALDDQ
ncbi:CD74 molecule, major histocompatibility complex, class II invariant chain a isoform 3-T3 [Pholidichthys leucotaenia]